jgi:hypothetical protein
MRMPLAAIATVLLVSACGSAGVGTGSIPSPSPTPHRFDVAVSEKDTAATMRVGERLEVVLHAYNGMANWTSPKSSDESILAPVTDTAATAARGVTIAGFLARRAGEANLSANSAPRCSPGQACPMFIAVFSLTVTVTG